METSKNKVQLFENRKVRSVWDETVEKWWFSTVDVEEENEIVMICHGFQKIKREKSRRDGIFLTVDFNLRARNAMLSFQSPAGTTQWKDKISSLRDLLWRWTLCFRRLKPTVNKVLSLRDISSLIQHCYI